MFVAVRESEIGLKQTFCDCGLSSSLLKNLARAKG